MSRRALKAPALLLTPDRNITLVAPDRWVACSATEFGHVGETRHIARPGALTTVCGCTATTPDIWRGNTRKPRCAQCVTYYRRDEQR